MTKDTVEKASDSEGVSKENTKDEATSSSSSSSKKEPQEKTKQQPSLEVYARRLERLLSPSSISNGNNNTKANDNDLADIPTACSNPVKVVRRWLSSTTITTTFEQQEPQESVVSKATLSDIKKAIDNLFDPSSICYSELQSMLTDGKIAGIISSNNEDKMDIITADSENNTVTEINDSKISKKNFLKNSEREVQAWLLSLIIRILYRRKEYDAALDLSSKALNITQNYLLSSKYPPTSLYPLLARLYRYHCLIAEFSSNPTQQLHSSLISAHRLACIHHDIDTQSTLLNLLLRSMLASHQIEQAQKLLSNSSFPDTASNNQTCRYLYYSGRVQALRLEYTTSYSNLSTCLRKAPTSDTNKGIVGFRIEVTRLLSIVQLLMGDIPPRTLFTPYKELTPYLKLTQAVRKGDLQVFSSAVQQFRTTFVKDGMLTLISRLEHSVVKAGLRKLYLSYSKISLQDIASRLALPSATTAEFIVAKAIKDGVIDATIDHENQYVYSHDSSDIYISMEPCSAFHRRVAYCLSMHNDAVRGMRFLPDAYKKTLEAAGSAIVRKDGDDKTDEEKAKELEDEFDEDF